jgi:hypothetical protein
MELEALEVIKKHQKMHGRLKGNEIRKEYEKKSKYSKSKSRGTVVPIDQPRKFINPYNVYKLYSDHPLIETEENYYASITAITEWKYVCSVSINQKAGFLSAIYANHNNYKTPSWQYLVERMKSKGTSDAYLWANTIETFSRAHETLRNTKQFHSFLLKKASFDPAEKDKIAQIKQELCSNTLLYAVKFNFGSPEGQIVSTGYNLLLANALGFEKLEELAFPLLKDGFLQVLYATKQYTVGSRDHIAQFYDMDHNVAIRDKPTTLYDRYARLVPVIRNDYTFASYNAKGEPELELYLSFNINGTPKALTSDENSKSIDKEYIAIQTQLREDAKGFLKQFYPQWNVAQDDLITCQIKPIIEAQNPSFFLKVYEDYKLFLVFLSSRLYFIDFFDIQGHAISEKNGQITTSCSHLNRWKIVTLDSKGSKGLITAKLQNSEYHSPPWRYIVDRWRSYGDISFYEWADAIEDASLTYDKLVDTNSLANYFNKLSIHSNEQEAFTDDDDDSVFITRYTITKDGADMTAVEFSEKLVKQLEYSSREEFCNSILEKGLPNVLEQKEDAMNIFKDYLHYFFKQVKGKKDLQIPINLITKSHVIIPVTQTLTYKICHTEDDHKIEVEVKSRYQGADSAMSIATTDNSMELEP